MDLDLYLQFQEMVGPEWSWRFDPTPGRSITSGIPRECRREEGPIPLRCSMAADPKVPADRMTSLFTVMFDNVPSARDRTSTAGGPLVELPSGYTTRVT